MFFIASKIFWMLASPINLLLFGALVGVALCYGRHARFGRGLALTAILVLLAVAFLPVSALLMAPLEDRFPQPPADLKPPYGIVVLGGAVNDDMSAARGQTIFDEGGERITEAVILSKRFPQARVVYTSGTNSLLGGSSNEAARARDLMVAMGVARRPDDDRRQGAQHRGERCLHCRDRPSGTVAALDCRYLSIPHAARDGSLRKGRISSDRLSGFFLH